MSVDALFESGAHPRAHLQQRYDDETLAKYQADLERIQELVAAGKRLPTLAAIRRHMMEQHHVQVTDATLRQHLTKLANGESLWPAQ